MGTLRIIILILRYTICVTVAVEGRRSKMCTTLTVLAETPATITFEPFNVIYNPIRRPFTAIATVCHDGKASAIEYSSINEGKNFNFNYPTDQYSNNLTCIIIHHLYIR